jgi:hypothetical protein
MRYKVQREASALRDDVNILIHEYLSLLEKKLITIRAISLLTANAHSSLLSSDIESAQTCLDENDYNIIIVEKTDWEISRTARKIAGIAGIKDYDRAIASVLDSDETLKNTYHKIKTEIANCNALTEKAVSSIIKDLEDEKEKTVKTLSEISGLKKIRELLIFPEKD